MNKKELKKINKKETCGGFTVNREFGKEFKEITGECATLTKVEKIRDIIAKEIDNGVITTKEETLQRRFELIHELYILGEDVQPREKTIKNYCTKCGAELTQDSKYCTECGTKIEAQEEIQPQEEVQPLKTKYDIEIPYTSSGIMMGYGTGTFGGVGAIGSRIGEGETKWRYRKCYVRENGLSIEETGDFIRFDKIESINTGEKEGILFKHINVTLELKNEKTFSFRVPQISLPLLKIIEDNMISEDNIIPENNTTVENNNSGLDELLKAKELLEAGLLTTEEFNELKIKLLNNI